MSPDDFRRIALGLPEVWESAHMGHPDFRVSRKIFATLGYPEEGWGMVKLTPEQQDAFVAEQPTAYVPVNGAWGRRGCTNVLLGTAGRATLPRALAAAWRNIAPRRLTQRLDEA
jgi:hypothetical protein